MSAPITFQAWPKTPRLNRLCTITEKIDGTNAAVGIRHLDNVEHYAHDTANGECIEFSEADAPNVLAVVNGYVVFAQSRTRLIRPGADNFGFAAWVQANAGALVEILGQGVHYGEWWGSKIQRGYGLTNGEKRFSLFNPYKQGAIDAAFEHGVYVRGLGTVPLIYQGTFSTAAADAAVESLREHGSRAMPGYMNPEGIVVYHMAAGTGFKVLLEHDELPKGQFIAPEAVAA
jgi:hypothetical protein